MRTYKVEYFRQLGDDPDPSTDEKLGEVNLTDGNAGKDHTVTLTLPVGTSKVYSQVTDQVSNIARLSEVRSYTRSA